MSASIPERTVESWLALELETWFPGVRLWAPTQSAVGNWDVAAQGAGKLLIFECKGCEPLQAGHSVPINMPQLQRYAAGAEFADVRDHVFYVLPAPPWQGPAPAPNAPFAPPAALPAAHAEERLAGPAGGCWEWFHVTLATELLAALNATGRASVNTRRLPSPPALGLAPHPLGPLPATSRLNDFLDDVANCRRVRLTGTESESGSSEPGAEGGEWRRPNGRASGGPPVWPGDDQPTEPPERANDTQWVGDDHQRSAPTPIVAFIPRRLLATP
jgi:hypothetical protein